MADLEHYKKYGWEVNETNLSTLPDTAPQAAKDLVKWLTLEGRRKSLTEWISHTKDDSRIHGKFWNIGTWTGRMSHSNPNQANIAAPFHGTPSSPVEVIKDRYDASMRALWKATPGKFLVGTDLDGAQLRVLTCEMKSEAWRTALMNGDKKAGTDIHSMNKAALGSVCKDRDTAKTFIYAFLLGAAIPKLAEILNCSTAQATSAYNQFLDYFPELKRLKQLRIPADAARGYFIGLDGRKVKCNSEHLMLAGYLQSGESIIAKYWVREWRMMAKAQGLWFRHVDFVHDEVQVEVNSEEDGHSLIKIQEEAMEIVNKRLNLFCPMAIEGKIGTNWLESH